MKTLLCITIGIFLLVSNLAINAKASIVEYTGEWTDIFSSYSNPIDPNDPFLTQPGPFGAIGTPFNMNIDYDPITLNVNEIILDAGSITGLDIVSWSDFGIFNSPANWHYVSMTTDFNFQENKFTINSEQWGGQTLTGTVNPVPEPRSVLLLTCGLVLLSGCRIKCS